MNDKVFKSVGDSLIIVVPLLTDVRIDLLEPVLG